MFEQLQHSPGELIVALGRGDPEQLMIDALEYPHIAVMVPRMQTKDAQAAYEQHMWISEPPSGWVNNVLGFRQFSLRSLVKVKVKVERRLFCAALGLRRMTDMMPA